MVTGGSGGDGATNERVVALVSELPRTSSLSRCRICKRIFPDSSEWHLVPSWIIIVVRPPGTHYIGQLIIILIRKMESGFRSGTTGLETWDIPIEQGKLLLLTVFDGTLYNSALMRDVSSVGAALTPGVWRCVTETRRVSRDVTTSHGPPCHEPPGTRSVPWHLLTRHRMCPTPYIVTTGHPSAPPGPGDHTHTWNPDTGGPDSWPFVTWPGHKTFLTSAQINLWLVGQRL